MLKIAFISSIILAATGTAFAGSDHYDGSNSTYQPSIAIDNSATASVTKSDAAPYKNVDTQTKTGATAKTTTMTAPSTDYGQGIWGN